MLAFKPPSFKYTGPLRPHYVTPQRSVPAHIKTPDYALTTIPQEELNARAVTTIEVKTEEQLKLMRAACKVRFLSHITDLMPNFLIAFLHRLDARCWTLLVALFVRASPRRRST
jgi:hypothetical protein